MSSVAKRFAAWASSWKVKRRSPSSIAILVGAWRSAPASRYCNTFVCILRLVARSADGNGGVAEHLVAGLHPAQHDAAGPHVRVGPDARAREHRGVTAEIHTLLELGASIDLARAADLGVVADARVVARVADGPERHHSSHDDVA